MSVGRETSKAESVVDTATALRIALEPVLVPASASRPFEQMCDALQIARAGISISATVPEWVLALDVACQRLQQKLLPARRAQQLATRLQPLGLPKPLQEASEHIKKRATVEAREAARRVQRWRKSEEGLQCRVSIRCALKQGAKSRAFILPDSQIDECLHRGENRLDKLQRKVAQQATWNRIKKHGKAAEQQQCVQQFVCLLGHSMVSLELQQAMKRYKTLCDLRQSSRWLKRILKHDTLQTDASASAGALWMALHSEQTRIEHEVFVATAVGALDEPIPETVRAKPELPLRLHFGVTEANVG